MEMIPYLLHKRDKTRPFFLYIMVCFISFLHGCSVEKAKIEEGCYHYSDGDLAFKIINSQGFFGPDAAMKSFKVGEWIDRERGLFEVTPAFVLHDGTVSLPNGPSKIPQIVSTKPSGMLKFESRGGQDVILVPREAYGELEVTRGGSC